MATINSWANVISSAAVTLNGGAVNIGSDNAANAINIGVGTTARTVGICNSAAAHVLTVGSNNGAASTTIQYGTTGLSVTGGSGGQSIAITSAGQIIMPLQAKFSAYKSSTSTNVTGDGTAATVVFDTEQFDVGSNYNSGTGVFTAPVTGKYFFQANLMYSAIGVQTTAQCRIDTAAHNYDGNYLSPTACQAGGNFLAVNASVIISLSASDTVSVTAAVTGGTKTVSVFGNATELYTYFTGYLIG